MEQHGRVKAMLFLPFAAFGALLSGAATAFSVVFLFLVRLPSDAHAAAPGSISFDSPLQDKLFLPAIFASIFTVSAVLTAVLVRRAFGGKGRRRGRGSRSSDAA
jgi:hypothetical protein